MVLSALVLSSVSVVRDSVRAAVVSDSRGESLTVTTEFPPIGKQGMYRIDTEIIIAL